MRDSLLVQVGTHGWCPVLDMLAPYHEVYAERHEMDYRPVREPLQVERHPIWDKVAAIREGLAAGYQWVFCLDADVLIVQPEADLRDALRWGAIGLCAHQHAHMDFHLNTGATYLQASDPTREFYEAVWDFPYLVDWDGSDRPLGSRGGEQHAVNRVLEAREWDLAEILHARWHSTVTINPTRNPIVRGWHGMGDIEERGALMALQLERLNR